MRLSTRHKPINNIRDVFRNVEKLVNRNDSPSFWGFVKDYPKEEDVTVAGEILFYIPRFHRNTKVLYSARPINANSYIKPARGTIIYVTEINGLYYYYGRHASSLNENGDNLLKTFTTNLLGLNNNEDAAPIDFQPNDEGIPVIEEKENEYHIKGMNNNNIVMSYDENQQPKISIIVNREDSSYNTNTTGLHIYGQLDPNIDLEYVGDGYALPDDDPEISSAILIADKLRFVGKAGSIMLTTPADIVFDTPANITLGSGGEIMLGRDAEEPLVLGDKLVSTLSALIDAIMAMTVGTATGPSSPPINASQFAKIKSELNSILSILNKTV